MKTIITKYFHEDNKYPYGIESKTKFGGVVGIRWVSTKTEQENIYKGLINQ